MCNGGTCQSGCWIQAESKFVADGVTDIASGNICKICDPTKSTTDWSNNDSATSNPCGSCGGTAACVSKALGPCSKDLQTYYRDADGDGYGTPLITPVPNCNPTPGWVTKLGDCVDTDSSIYAGVKRCFGAGVPRLSMDTTR